MRKLIRRLIPIALVAALAPVTVAQAKVAAKSEHPLTSLFFARPNGEHGIALAYDLKTGQEQFKLPAGMVSSDGSVYAAAEFTGDDDTKLNTYDAKTGQETLYMPLTSRWSLSAISPTGNYVALTRVPNDKDRMGWAKSGKWQTELQIIDVKSYRPKHTLKLNGNFEVETISADGTSLFLIEHLPAAKPDYYVIRWYDLSKEQLVADPIRSKTADEVMAGYAWGSLASSDGNWLFTLYLNTNRNVAFIHMLNLQDKITICVDLPSDVADKSKFDLLKHYTLAYSPQRNKVYATNAALGMVAEVDLNSLNFNGSKFVENKRVTFKPNAPLKSLANSLMSHGAMTQDEKTIYFATGGDVYAYDIARGTVSQPYRANGIVTGLAASEDGRQLFIARDKQPVMAFDVQSRQALSLPAAGRAP